MRDLRICRYIESIIIVIIIYYYYFFILFVFQFYHQKIYLEIASSKA